MSDNYATSPRITVFPATLNRFTGTPITEKRKRCVAAYARVSTNSDEQKTSYEAQVSYYTDYISAKPDWHFVQVYADKGITGTSTKHRERFNDMIADALAGKIDLIITKSVSRFARNTVDSLATIRLLKEHGVEVCFEEQNIYALDSKGELLLTIMSSLAQEESRSISENVTWGQRKRFAERRCLRGGAAGIGATKKARPPTQQPALLLWENLLWLLRQRVRQQGLAFQRQIPPHRLAMQRPVCQENWMPSVAPERTDD